MDLLQKLLERELTEGAVAEVLVRLLSAKLAEKGVRLSSRERDYIRERLRRQDLTEISLRTWMFWEPRHIEIELSEEDLHDVERSMERLIQNLPELMDSVSEQTAGTLLASLRKGWARQSRLQQKDSADLHQQLGARWNSAFSQLEMLLTIALEFGASSNAHLRSIPFEIPNKVDILTRLHARACQVAAEVIHLLRGGFADGALARWRTLHEITVVALFLAEGDELLAEQYALHQIIESRKAAEEYQRFSERLGYERWDPQEIVILEREQATLVSRFGTNFESRHGWAAQKLGIADPTFAQIEHAVGMAHMRPYYRMASHNVHANPKGAFFKLGLLDEQGVLLAGPSVTGLADPGQNTALSLVQTTAALATLNPTIDAIVVCKVMRILAAEISEAFVTIQGQIESKSGKA